MTEKIQIQVADNGKMADFAGVAARVEHAPTPKAPSNRSDAVDLRHRQELPERAESGLHGQLESKDSLAREDHAPSSDEPHDQYFRQ
jgi:hypothetical protein